MSVKIRAKNPSDLLQTLECDASGHMLCRNSTAEGKLDTLETTLTAIETDAAALEVLQTSTNTKLDTLETTLTAIETDAAALEVLQTSTNTKLDTLETTLTAIETDAAALEVLQTAGNSSLADIKTAVEVIDDVVLTDGSSYSSSSTKGVMLLAKDNSGNMKPVELNSSSELKVSSTGGGGSETFEVHTSTHSSVSSGASITSSVETLTKRNCQVGFIITSSESNPPGQTEVQVSADNSTFSNLSAGGGFNYQSDGSGGQIAAINMEIPFPFVRVKMTAATGSTHNVVIKITH